jgi:hypothetical protein
MNPVEPFAGASSAGRGKPPPRPTFSLVVSAPRVSDFSPCALKISSRAPPCPFMLLPFHADGARARVREQVTLHVYDLSNGLAKTVKRFTGWARPRARAGSLLATRTHARGHAERGVAPE